MKRTENYKLILKMHLAAILLLSGLYFFIQGEASKIIGVLVVIFIASCLIQVIVFKNKPALFGKKGH